METRPRKLPIGIQSFEKLREGGNVYVDKTMYISKFLESDAPYFLARPRRFGKSLFLSTLKAYFLGKKELFEGLAIAKIEKDWLEYPVFHINFSTGIINDLHALKEKLNAILLELEQEWGRTFDVNDPAIRFEAVIKQAYKKTGRKVVVLVDEYNKPLLNSIENDEINYSMRDELKGFYGVLKGADEYLRFVFLTGVTKFSKVSVFSDLNHLVDISMIDNYAGICGISETELMQNFEPEIKALADKTGENYEQTFAKLKKHYNGYHFSRSGEGMYNPFSLLNTFNFCQFSNYWFATGTPTFLVKMLKNGRFDIPNLDDNIFISVNDINDYRTEWQNSVPILYQSGYLTIKEYESEYQEYRLGFPNEEVKYGFWNNLLPEFVPQYNLNQNFSAMKFTRTLRAGDIDGFMLNMQAFYGSIPYDMTEKKDEQYFQFVFYLIVSLMGQFVQTEVKCALGRTDAVINTADAVYVFEFKMAGNGTAESAFKQIDEKGYMIPYATENKKLVKIGAEFSEENRGMKRWLIEEVKNY